MNVHQDLERLMVVFIRNIILNQMLQCMEKPLVTDML